MASMCSSNSLHLRRNSHSMNSLAISSGMAAVLKALPIWALISVPGVSATMPKAGSSSTIMAEATP